MTRIFLSGLLALPLKPEQMIEKKKFTYLLLHQALYFSVSTRIAMRHICASKKTDSALSLTII